MELLVDIKTIKSLEEAIAIITKQQKMITDNNTYIGKVEKERDAFKLAAESKGETDPTIKAYVLEKRMDEQKDSALINLVKNYGQGVVDAMKTEFDAWCKKFAKPEDANVAFFENAFQMLLGQALGKEDHPVKKEFGKPKEVKDGGDTPPPNPTPTPRVVDGDLPPNPVNPSDRRSADPGNIPPAPTGVKSTEEAYGSFAKKLANINTTPYDS